ncbi:SAM-dependent methyltransferase [Candidatus Methylospira mobilis]|uniref:protein-glutamate O-methyltransferase n=1 Tax=Candidatus Methylospira mobilis TaxID=1808979 RepID=A0A5Q0BJA9_9GAMM|nr:chemotaxis protein CheB [Candidatus Methylospira mobilis]QFY42247.1 SAM-dependent methyltransferase [Candidatus Methylospira mobilis]
MPIKKTDDAATVFHIVGIGASAGGLEAFKQFFLHTAADTGMAFVLVSHLDPDRDSLLADILQRSTIMPVAEALDQMPVEPNRVYVIPPNREMVIAQGRLQLSVPLEPRGQRMAVDKFLGSLAEDRKKSAIGIVLSGSGTDGTLGLQAIQDQGGVTFAQQPDTAEFDGMPSSAIQAGCATHILPVDKMPEAVLACAGTLASQTETPAFSTMKSGIRAILKQLLDFTGHDFSLYKKSTIVRRIERRMHQLHIEDIEVYAHYIEENPDESRNLFKELLINVTGFFRDAEAFAVLRNDILPKMCRDKADDYVFRVWVAGCATGEEAYTIAILLRELMEKTHQPFKTQIYSTDLDDSAIAVARQGIYPPSIAQDVAQERLQRFFTREDARYRVKKDIREMVVFATQNVIKDPPFTRIDLISCRNLLIYLTAELQNRLIPKFHYALNPGGVLFLSPSESIGNHTELFSSIHRKWKFYRVSHSNLSSRAAMARGMHRPAESGGKPPEQAMKKASRTKPLQHANYWTPVQCFAQASVTANLQGDIICSHGETGRYLHPASEHTKLNVIEMAREGLELELRSAFHAAAGEGIATLNREVRIESYGGSTSLSLSVKPLPCPVGAQRLLLVSFHDVTDTAVKLGRERSAKPGRIEELERDLAYLKECHQTTVEELQVSNEELKSTNEELQSTNEELQSTNEELETSTDELHLANEELITVNSELHSKIEQLERMQNDMKNLLDNISVGIIFLDRRLMIRSFTQEAVRIYPLIATDVGRPLNDFKPVVEEGGELLPAARSVLESLMPYERELKINGNAWVLARIQPYRMLDNVIDGIVLTFTDITARINAVAAQEALNLAEGIVNTVREPLVVLDSTMKVVTASRSFYQEFQVTAEETAGSLIFDLGCRQWDHPALHELLEKILPDDRGFEGFVLEQDFPVIGHRRIVLNARQFIGKAGEPQLILLSMEVDA